MTKKTKYSDGPVSNLRLIDDFLPDPADLAFKEDNVKVTIGLSRRSVEFFKAQAGKHHTQYQKMIRRLLDVYAMRHRGTAASDRRK